jgi:hypothetical protein
LKGYVDRDELDPAVGRTLLNELQSGGSKSGNEYKAVRTIDKMIEMNHPNCEAFVNSLADSKDITLETKNTKLKVIEDQRNKKHRNKIYNRFDSRAIADPTLRMQVDNVQTQLIEEYDEKLYTTGLEQDKVENFTNNLIKKGNDILGDRFLKIRDAEATKKEQNSNLTPDQKNKNKEEMQAKKDEVVKKYKSGAISKEEAKKQIIKIEKEYDGKIE